jgi:hypothetical protein
MANMSDLRRWQWQNVEKKNGGRDEQGREREREREKEAILH